MYGMNADVVFDFVNRIVKEIDDPVMFQCFLGMVTDYWTSTHGGDPHEFLEAVLQASDQVNEQEGKANSCL